MSCSADEGNLKPLCTSDRLRWLSSYPALVVLVWAPAPQQSDRRIVEERGPRWILHRDLVRFPQLRWSSWWTVSVRSRPRDHTLFLQTRRSHVGYSQLVYFSIQLFCSMSYQLLRNVFLENKEEEDDDRPTI